MDPFEEFEFKPLTDGLGFHRKKMTVSKFTKEDEELKSSQFIKDQGLTLLDDASMNPMSSPLPRKQSAPTKISKQFEESSTHATDELLKTLQKNRRFNIEETTDDNRSAVTIGTPLVPANKPTVQTTQFKSSFKTTNKVTQTAQAISTNMAKDDYKETNWSFASGLLDSMLVVAASILCMIILLVVTQTDLIGNLTHPDQYGMIYVATFAIFATVGFIYLSVNRIFMGCTPGEWAFDQRIGRPSELNSRPYGLKVIGRSALIVMTGFVVLPLLSLLFRKDIAGAITGAKILRRI